MGTSSTDIYVYADWFGIKGPKAIGVLTAHQAKGHKAFGFEYYPGWLTEEMMGILDPDIGWYRGKQYPYGKENFGIFTDSMPDTWGRTLMRRRASLNASLHNQTAPKLYDIDFLLGVYDPTRMGALRYKLDPKGPFLDNNELMPTPPWTRVRELQNAALHLESGQGGLEESAWLEMLISPGSSLGGARPKANILDEKGLLWIAKFPSLHDGIDKASWEFLAYQLAQTSGITMAESRLQTVGSNYKTFFTKRFDRAGAHRIHFASGMTMLGKNEELLRNSSASYLDLVDFIITHGAQPNLDLNQLWRRMVFNICISNTDDHLRNHGFVLTPKGWILSPAFDINPSIDKTGLSLNIDGENNHQDLDLAKSVGVYFRLNNAEMSKIISEIQSSISKWRVLAKNIGISRIQQEFMEPAFL